MKYTPLLCTALALSLFLTGCGSNAAQEPAPQDEPAAVEPDADDTELDIEDEEDEPTDAEDDENAPEHLVPEAIDKTTPVTLYTKYRIDSTETIYECATVNLPSMLEVDEALTVEDKGSSDFNDDDLTIEQYLDGLNEHVLYLEANGSVPGTRAATDHQITISTSEKNEPATLESMQEDYGTKPLISEISVGGAQGFIAMPDPASGDSGFVETAICLNIGSIEHAYGTNYYTLTLYYSGGMMDYADADFEALKTALTQLISVNFKPAE